MYQCCKRYIEVVETWQSVYDFSSHISRDLASKKGVEEYITIMSFILAISLSHFLSQILYLILLLLQCIIN